ncbi:MAG: hypothetical protein KAV87_00075, partial [Desulfobacteraceae bacterium]|nr:hypothetical protein [Desulfobacteraceae bacterium]
MQKLPKVIRFLCLIILSLSLAVLLVYPFFIAGQSMEQNALPKVIKARELSKTPKINIDYGKIPLYFIPNKGQVDGNALFYAKTSQYILWMTKEGLVFDSVKKTGK